MTEENTVTEWDESNNTITETVINFDSIMNAIQKRFGFHFLNTDLRIIITEQQYPLKAEITIEVRRDGKIKKYLEDHPKCGQLLAIFEILGFFERKDLVALPSHLRFLP